MPRISFAWTVITHSHQITNNSGEFPKGSFFSMSGDTASMKS